MSNAIVSRAVSEAGPTNVAVKELGDAAGRIGDVIKLITDIAEQTNLLAFNAIHALDRGNHRDRNDCS